MVLTTFQRRQLRRIVSLSDQLYASRLALSDRRRETNNDLLEARSQAQLIEQAIAREAHRHVREGMADNLAAWRGRIAELEQVVAISDQSLEEINPVVDAAGRLADRLLSHGGVNRSLFGPHIAHGSLLPRAGGAS